MQIAVQDNRLALRRQQSAGDIGTPRQHRKLRLALEQCPEPVTQTDQSAAIARAMKLPDAPGKNAGRLLVAPAIATRDRSPSARSISKPPASDASRRTAPAPAK